MSFESYEESIYHGEPIDLYTFVYGSGANERHYFVDCEGAVTVAGITYTPVAIRRGAINSSGTLDKSSLNIEVDALSPIAELFRVYPPTQPVTLVMQHGHVGDPDEDFKVVWTGRVLGCGWEESIATLNCEPVSTSMLRTGLRRHWQYGCPHALYMGDEKGGCRADKDAATQTTTVSAVTGSIVTLPVGWNGTRDKAKFVNGLVEWDNGSGSFERRAILKVNTAANVITIGGPIVGMAAGNGLRVILGCNHQMTDCDDLHHSINDFGGQPWIPTKNPFGNTQNYY